MSTVTTSQIKLTPEHNARARVSVRSRLQDALPKIVLAPSFAITIIFVYGFILWTIYLSFTNSKTFPSYAITGSRAYRRLWGWTFDTDPPSSWYTSIINMGTFGFLYIFILAVSCSAFARASNSSAIAVKDFTSESQC